MHMLDLEHIGDLYGCDLEWDLCPSSATVVDDQLQAPGVGLLDLLRLGAREREVANRLTNRAVEPIEPRAELGAL